MSKKKIGIKWGGECGVDVKNCTHCGKLFRPVGGRRVCPDCVQAEREEFDKVREHLRTNPQATVMEVSQQTGVSTKKIKEYIRDGRLQVTGEEWGLKCENCGEQIDRGRYCPRCASEIEQGLKGPKPTAPPTRRRKRAEWSEVVHRDGYRRR